MIPVYYIIGLWVRGPGRLIWGLCLGSHKAKLMVWAKQGSPPEALGEKISV